MKHKVQTSEPVLYEALIQRGFVKKRAIQLQNLYTHFAYRAFSIDSLENPCDLCVLTEALKEWETKELVERAAMRHTTVAIMSPYNGRERTNFCYRLIETHPCTSVDKRAFLLFFSDSKLPKQHYRI